MSSPSAYYQQHRVVEAPRVDELVFRPYWKVLRPKTRLDRLFADGAISELEIRAALRFRAAVEHLIGARHGFRHDRSVGGGGERGLSAVMRVTAFAHVRRVQAALGRFATGLIWSCVIDNLSWTEVGARLGVDRNTARAWTIAALRALAAFEGGWKCTAGE